MRIDWRRPAIGLSSGLFQASAYLVPQLAAAIVLSLGLPHGQLGWVSALGYSFPVGIALLLAAGDWLGGRVLILSLAGATLAGVALLTAGGALAAAGSRGWAVVAVYGGAILVPAGLRLGSLVAGHETRGLAGDDQLREARGLRRYLVLGIYLVPLPAGLVAVRFGWPWVVGGIGALQVAALALLARRIRPDARRGRPRLGAFVRGFAAELADRWLLAAAAGAFLTQSAVFAYVAGMPAALARRGFSAAASGAVLTAAVLAALFVDRPRRMSSARFGRLAGVWPAAGLSLAFLVAATVDAGGDPRTSSERLSAAAYLGVLALTSVVVELGKQWGQSLGPLQARAGAGAASDHRRRAVVELGANLGAGAGVAAGAGLASIAEQAWLGLCAGLALLAWAATAAWFRRFPRPWRLGGRRWCYRGGEYVLALGASMAADRVGAIYEAPAEGDEIRLDRPRAEFDPAVTSVEAAFARVGGPRRHRRRRRG